MTSLAGWAGRGCGGLATRAESERCQSDHTDFEQDGEDPRELPLGFMEAGQPRGPGEDETDGHAGADDCGTEPGHRLAAVPQPGGEREGRYAAKYEEDPDVGLLSEIFG